MKSPLIIFDDGRGELGPLTDLRAAFEIRTGMYTTATRIANTFPKQLAGYWAPGRLAQLVQTRASVPVNQLPETKSPTILCISGRWVSPDPRINLKPSTALIEENTGDIIAALLSPADARSLLETGELPETVDKETKPEGTLCRFPWHVVSALKCTIEVDIRTLPMLDAMVTDGEAQIVGTHPVKVHESAKIYPGVIFDAEYGPIAVRKGAVIRPGVILHGPCSVGKNSTVLDHALIKAHTAIGPACKVAGEVGATVFQGFANKAHDGHIGDSYVGKWVNLGAGTTNSNLLNTYSEIIARVEVDGSLHRTGMNFLGTIFGDHVKTAICTRIMTGTVLGTGAMVASSTPPPTCLSRFSWLTDQGQRAYRYKKFRDVMETQMARRDVEPSEQYLAVLKELHERYVSTS